MTNDKGTDAHINMQAVKRVQFRKSNEYQRFPSADTRQPMQEKEGFKATNLIPIGSSMIMIFLIIVPFAFFPCFSRPRL